MTTQEIITMTNEAYRKGYLDGVNDRKDVSVSYTPMNTEPVDDVIRDAMAQSLQNILQYDGKLQPDFEMSRTK